MERRKHPRIQVQWRISFFVGPSSLKEDRFSGAGTASDLSVRGCKVLGDTRVYLGMLMELRRIEPEEEERLRRFANNFEMTPSR